MLCTKMRKVDKENLAFKEEWTDKYGFILPAANVKPLCLICSETVALIKSANVKCHYETKHRSFEQTYPQQSDVRTGKINSKPSVIGPPESSPMHSLLNNVQMNVSQKNSFDFGSTAEAIY